MANSRNENSEKLRYWLLTIPPIDKRKVFCRIYEECLITPPTLTRWRYGQTKIPLTGLRDLNRVAKEYSGYELFEIVPPDAPLPRRKWSECPPVGYPYNRPSFQNPNSSNL